jgi:glycerol-3-phosphate acyltransferase PlsX
MDPDMYGSAPLLGLNGLVFKSHASATDRAIRNGIRLATEAHQHQINDRIANMVEAAHVRLGLISEPSSTAPA